MVVNYLRGTEIEEAAFDQITNIAKLDHQTAGVCFSGIQLILKSALRSKSKPEILAKDMQDLKLAPSLINALVNILKGRYVIEFVRVDFPFHFFSFYVCYFFGSFMFFFLCLLKIIITITQT